MAHHSAPVSVGLLMPRAGRSKRRARLPKPKTSY